MDHYELLVALKKSLRLTVNVTEEPVQFEDATRLRVTVILSFEHVVLCEGSDFIQIPSVKG